VPSSYPREEVFVIVAHDESEYTHFYAHDTPGVSAGVAAAWMLTRTLATRRYVNTMIAEADGVIRSNSYPRKFPTIGHMPPNTPWTIDLTDEVDHLFRFAVFDLDAKTPEAFEQASEDLGVLVRVLRSVNIPHVVCRSSPTGGFHVWVALTGVEKNVMSELASAARAVLPSLDHGLLCNDRTGAVRPPTSPHSRGGFSEVMGGADGVDVLVSPTVTAADLQRVIAALRELRPEVDPQLTVPHGETAARHRLHRELPSWGVAMMATVAGGYDPSRTGYMCLLAAAVAGWSFDDVERAAQTAPGMEHYRTRNNASGGPRIPRRYEEARARLERQWQKAQERVRLNRYAPQNTEPRDLTELHGIVESTEGMLTAFRVSPGRWARSEAAFHDAAVLTALAWLALRSGQRDVSAALRTLAGITGIPSSSVHRSLVRLRADGWVLRKRASEGIDAAVYRLTERFSTPSAQDGPHHKTTARPPHQLFDDRIRLLEDLEDRIAAGAHDVFTRSGLGPTARRAYEALRPAEADERAVSERAGLPLGRTRAVLAKLKRYALVVATKAGQWRRRLRDNRASAARRLGVEGTLARRQQQYAWERELWAWWNAETTFRGGRTPKQRRRPDPKQGVMFKLRDLRGDDLSWPAYPRGADGRADHLLAMRYVREGMLQQLRDEELASWSSAA